MKHLLIDFENLQPENLDQIPVAHTHIWLFVGAIQKNITIELAQSLLRFGERAHIVRVKKTGKNALDFYLSYYLGKITATDPEATIVILSKDGGYDLLLEHIEDEQQAQGIVRLAALDSSSPATAVPAVLPETPEADTTPQHRPVAPYYRTALAALRQAGAFRPSRVHNLFLNIKNHILLEQLSDKDEAEREHIVHIIIRKLTQHKLIDIDDARQTVTYHLSDRHILQKIRKYVLQHKPKTAAEFQAMVLERAEALALTVGENDVVDFTRLLVQEGLLRQVQNNMLYPPFPSEAPSTTPTVKPPTPSQAAPVKAPVKQPIPEKLLAIIQVKNRPTKRKKLLNAITTTLKCSRQQAEQYVANLEKQKYFAFNGETIVYKK
ncbi:PIN domain-containing protein [Conchiformibius steedae DSM 2580]|uniref:PIN domain-containing protein n=1 Tax=Conchiformibius steedae DSM 2580 TaxID=1121352 RepID=A0AAE9KYN3_9NEIS|nr:PIN domain-containing protein [Conchiformibius steedae]QMT33212.1 hypothetical protein H3L98_08960 [Conchiformibius steedae]URD67852.1 PIN domain-containing protein [Conchiformibius steedae DSM 2580]